MSHFWKIPNETRLTIKYIVVLVCSKENLTDVLLQVPLLPWLPLFSIFVNIYLMMQLDLATWCRFAVWMGVGKLLQPDIEQNAIQWNSTKIN